MNKREANKHIKACHKLYDEIGPSAVYDYANKHKLKNYHYCIPCEARTPVVNETCLLCGSHVPEPALSFVVENKKEDIEFSVRDNSGSDYPSFDININGRTAAIVEFNPLSQEVRVHSYLDSSDEPERSLTHKKL